MGGLATPPWFLGRLGPTELLADLYLLLLRCTAPYQHKGCIFLETARLFNIFSFGECVFFWWPFQTQRNYQLSLLSLWGTTPKFAEFELLSQSHFPRDSFDGPGKFEQHYLFQNTSHFALFAPGTPLTKPHFFTFGFVREQKSLLSGVRKPPEPFFLYFQR